MENHKSDSSVHSAKGRVTKFALLGCILIALGNSGFFLAAALGFFRVVLSLGPFYKDLIQELLWYSALPVVIGFFLVVLDLIFIVNLKRRQKSVINDSISNRLITVVLTAYNDEKSIEGAVRDFLSRDDIKRVIVVSNNSSDQTVNHATSAGAIVVNEPVQGYGACVVRALKEAIGYDDTEMICLCEGDLTFRARDVDKLLAYISHADVVNGTRIVEQLQDANTQVSTFIHYGNFAVAKLLEFKYLGDVTLTDVGTTYKLIRRNSLGKIINQLNNKINLEFNPYFLETCLVNKLSIIECPITFYPRVGESKGGNKSNFIALKLGIKMIQGIIFGWRGSNESR